MWILLGLVSVVMFLFNIIDLYKWIVFELKIDDEEKNENKVYKVYNF